MTEKRHAGRRPPAVPRTQTAGRKLLAEFCDDGTTQSHLARQAGVHRQTIQQLLVGDSSPSIEVAFKLQEATCGKVPAESWVQPADQA